MCNKENINKIKALQNELLSKIADVDSELDERGYTDKNILNQIPICIHEISITGIITRINPAGLDMLGMKKTDVIGSSYFSYISEEYTKVIKTNFENTLENRKTHKFIFNDINNRTYASCFTPLIIGGEIKKVIGYSQDITDILNDK